MFLVCFVTDAQVQPPESAWHTYWPWGDAQRETVMVLKDTDEYVYINIIYIYIYIYPHILFCLLLYELLAFWNCGDSSCVVYITCMSGMNELSNSDFLCIGINKMYWDWKPLMKEVIWSWTPSTVWTHLLAINYRSIYNLAAFLMYIHRSFIKTFISALYNKLIFHCDCMMMMMSCDAWLRRYACAL